MKKTKIKFDEIKAGDLIEAEDTLQGVKYTATGIAFEKIRTKQGDSMWQTSQGGTITIQDDEETIRRIDVAEVKFEDIREGDRIKVTVVNTDGRTEIVVDTVHQLVQGMNPFWVNRGPDTVLFRQFWEGEGAKRIIEILEREGE